MNTQPKQPPAQALICACGLLSTPPADLVVLDGACGAGIATTRMMDESGGRDGSVSVVCGDLDQTVVELAGERIREKGWKAKAERLDAQVKR